MQHNHTSYMLKVAFLMLAMMLSFNIIANANSPFVALLWVAGLWGAGYFIYSRRKSIQDWNESEVPLRDFILAQRQDSTDSSTLPENPATTKSFDDHDSTPLSEQERTRWSTLVNALETDDKLEIMFKKRERKNKKKRK